MAAIQRVGPAIAAWMLLSACSAQNESPRPQPPPVEETAFGDMAGAMDKARSVQDTALQRTEELNRALEENAGAADH